MFYDDRRMAGLFLFVGVAQFLVFLVVAEAVDPAYSVSSNFVSDLGVGAGAGVFNASIILLGLLTLLAAYYVHSLFHRWELTIFLLLTGIGATCVGVFTEAFGAIHAVVSLITFVGTGGSAIVAYRITKPPLSYFGVIMGLASFLALALFVSRNLLGIGVGGMERMIVLPVIGWALAFSGSLMAPASDAPAA